jgi:mannose-6-phosphate isomerase-like protein (cupin superfamily)
MSGEAGGKPVIEGDAARYEERVRMPGLTAGIYRLPPGAHDPQKPHGEDEVYYVLRGEGTFILDGQRLPAAPGSLFAVPRGVAHRFIPGDSGLELFVAFGPPEGTLTSQHPTPGPDPPT